MKEKSKKLLVAFGGLIAILGLVAVSRFFLGTRYGAFFSFALMMPVVGMLLNVRKSALYTTLFFAIRWFMGVLPITFGIPTACGAANWSLYAHDKGSKKSAMLKFLVSFFLPLMCMILFIIHPIGSQAFVYSFFWFIPIVLYVAYLFIPVSFFGIALSSVFISHAVGSVMWLYILPTSAVKWIALMPFVAVERLIFAVVGFCAYVIVKSLASKIKTSFFFIQKKVYHVICADK